VSETELSRYSGSGTDATVTGGSTIGNNNNIGQQLQGIVIQLANQIDSVKSVIGSVAKSNADTVKSVQDVKNEADRSYLIGLE
jgi:hypothetical protein